MSDALLDFLDDYVALYKRAHADVSPLFQQEKEAGLPEILQRMARMVPGTEARAADKLLRADELVPSAISTRVGGQAGNVGVDLPLEDLHEAWRLSGRARSPDLSEELARQEQITRLVEGFGFTPSTMADANLVAATTAARNAPPPPRPGGRPGQPAAWKDETGAGVTAREPVNVRGPTEAAPAGAAKGTQPNQPPAKQNQGGAPPADEGPPPRRGLGPLGATALAGGVGGGGYLYGQHKAEEEARRNRNLAFGAGLATGTVAPQIVRRAGGLLGNLGGGGGGYSSPYGEY